MLIPHHFNYFRIDIIKFSWINRKDLALYWSNVWVAVLNGSALSSIGRDILASAVYYRTEEVYCSTGWTDHLDGLVLYALPL